VSATVHKTKGIVLRTVKYGETSIIGTVYTELFGIQSYIINGVRTISKKGSSKANYFQPASILELEVYHNELKNLQRIKEFKWHFLYQHVLFDVIKNSVALFMIELLQKTIRQPEPNSDLYHFIEDALVHLDEADAAVTANFPVFFASHLTNFFGFRLSDEYDAQHSILDLQEGAFVSERPLHPYILEEPYSSIASQFLKVQQPHELKEIRINKEIRKILMNAYQSFYSLQIQEFGTMKTVAVLQEVI
jgi:DNA repair protein RecO (recombination protein O)